MAVKGMTYVQNDILFRELSQRLDACSSEHNGCENCQLIVECTRLFDFLADRAGDKNLSEHDKEWFESEFPRITTQLNLFG